MAEARHAQRILEIALTADESADTVVATSVKFYRNRQSYEDGNGFDAEFTAGAAAADHEIELGEVLPPPNVIVLSSTFQA
jgi:hypothetical protein